jgi:hypothetical protein
MLQVNYLAVLVAGVVIFMLGGLWYSPVMFAKRWVALQGKTMEEMSAAGGSMPVMYVQVFICGLLTAWATAVVLRFLPMGGLTHAFTLVGACWLGFVAATSYGTALFSGKSRALWLIDTTYNLFSILIAAAIVTKWG